MLGLAACITGVLAVQIVAVLVLLNQVPDSQRLNEFTRAVAADLGAALEAEPQLDAQRYIDMHYPKPLVSLYIVLSRSGRIVLRGSDRPTDASMAAASEFWAQQPAAVPDSWITGPFHTSPLLVHGTLAGGVGVVIPQTWEHLVGW